MSRTYRKLPHWTTEAKFTRERGSNWQGMVAGVLPNGNVTFKNFDEVKRCHAAKVHTNKIRRVLDKKEVDAAVTAMVNDTILAMEEAEALDAEYEFIDLMHYCYWDEYLNDMEPEPYDDDPYEDYYWNDYFDDWY